MSKSFALLSRGAPTFDQPVPVGQLYVPEWPRFETAMKGIFERRWYTNHGPLVQEFERKLENFLQVRNVICVTNATIGLLMAADALELTGSVIVPSHTFIATAQSLDWCGLKPIFCDVDPVSHQIDPSAAERLIGKDVSAILAVHLWGGACDVARLEQLSRDYGLSLYFDSAHAFGCTVGGRPVAGFGRLEVFSFHATKVLSATEGGCMTTNDDALAARLRNIRSSYGAGSPTAVSRTSNGRMSEAQAAMGLMSLEDFPKNRSHNMALFNAYERGLSDIPGFKLVRPANVTTSNFQYAACELDPNIFGLSRDVLLQLLHAENIIARRYFFPATHHVAGFNGNAKSDAAKLTVTERLTKTGLQLPLGARVDTTSVDHICELISRAHEQASEITHFAAGI